jgi:hypothetical protein
MSSIDITTISVGWRGSRHRSGVVIVLARTERAVLSAGNAPTARGLSASADLRIDAGRVLCQPALDHLFHPSLHSRRPAMLAGWWALIQRRHGPDRCVPSCRPIRPGAGRGRSRAVRTHPRPQETPDDLGRKARRTSRSCATSGRGRNKWLRSSSRCIPVSHRQPNRQQCNAAGRRKSADGRANALSVWLDRVLILHGERVLPFRRDVGVR